MTDAAEWCATLGCEGDPVDSVEYCRDCIDTSPKLVDDPDAAGESVNPADRSAETAECAGTTGSGDPAENGPATDRYSTDEPRGSHAEDGFADADFTAPEGGVWPPALLDREQWMGHVEKKPFAPWADRDHPEADPDEDARWKWGLTENYVDGETIAIAEDDHRLDGRAFLQREHDPFAYVDGDDVRDPETGEVHPAFVAVLDRLGLTYADVSQSGGGAHAIYQGELPEGVKEAAWQLDDEPWGDHDEGDLPSVEIYAGKRVCVATGEHVPGTPTEVREWDADALRELLDENDQLPDRGERHAGEREAFDLENYDPDATGADEVTGDIRDVYAAIDALDAQHVADETIVHRWNDDASTSDGTRAFYPTWGRNSNGTANIVDDQIWQDTGDEAGYGGPVVMALIDAGEMGHREASPRRATGATWYDGVDHLRELGFAVPVHVPEAGDENSAGETYDETPLWALRKAAIALDVCGREGFKEHETEDGETYLGFDRETFNATLDALDEAGIDHGREHIDDGVSGTDARQYDAETCVPPEFDPEPFDREAYRERLRGERYEAYLNADGPFVEADPPGVGKTAGSVLGAAARDREFFAAFDKHEKAREAITDDITPSDQFHIKGGEQPVHDCCMDAAAAADEGETPHCPEHGHPADWERMCPVYERSKDDDLRQRYEALVGPLGTLGAHLKLGLLTPEEHGWHGASCHWAGQFDELLDNEGRPLAERVAGVHEYQLLKSATEGRDTIVDESPRTLATDQRVDVDELVRAQVRLEELAEIQARDDAVGHNLRALAAFADDLSRAIASDDPGAFADLDAPELVWDTYESYGDVAGNYLETVPPEEPWHYAEALAQAKLEYNVGLVRKIEDGDVPSAPFCIDALLAAIAKAGVDNEAVRRAIAVPPILDSCPWCTSGLDYENGARVCASDECAWDERENTITQREGEQARASAWADDDPDDLDHGERPALVYGRLPAVDDLPDDPLVLDATATPEKVAGLYGTPHEDVDVTGDDPLDLDGRLNVTQVLDGQYHAQTIRDTESLQAKIQSVIDTAGELYESPLFGIRRDLIPLFDFPENGEVLVYGGARGLNREQFDAVVCIGAPHPDMSEIQRIAELLAMDRDDLRAGGEEYSTRRNAPNPPVYRKLLYESEDGDGLAVPTKAYSGVAGALFREAREKELEQFVHRIRPLLVEDAEPAKDAYLLTNVPTDLPIDDVVEFDELAGDLSAVFPVPEGALRLLGYGRDVLEGDAPDGFRDDAPIEARPGRTLVEVRDDGTIANKAKGWHRLAQANGEDVTLRTIYDWLDALEAVGLLTPEEYEQHAGVSYTADSSTLKSALQVLSSNGSFKVAAVRRFAAKVRGADGALDWLAWAEAVFDLSGDRCGWDPPPAPGG